MTEEGAKNKECRAPGVAVSDISGGFNTRGDFIWPNCNPSKCMHWKEIKNSDDYRFKTTDEGSVKCTSAPKVIGGFCGLEGNHD